MRDIIFITGGARSGKSHYALQQGMRFPGPRIFAATCPNIDPEMNRRIARHQKERSNKDWRTIEAQIDLKSVLLRNEEIPVILIDCLGLWVNNLMFREMADDEVSIRTQAEELVEICNETKQSGVLIVVSNEVGMGIVPETPLSRSFRDLLGRANQVFAQAAKEAHLMVSGLPLQLK